MTKQAGDFSPVLGGHSTFINSSDSTAGRIISVWEENNEKRKKTIEI